MRIVTLAAVALVGLVAFAGDRPAFVASAQEAAPDAETVLWRKAKTCEGFRAYLRAYPDGRYKAQALEEIADNCVGAGRSSSSSEQSRSYDQSPSRGLGDSSSARDATARDKERQLEAAEQAERAEIARMQAEMARQRANAEEARSQSQQASNAGAKEKPPAKTSPAPGPSPGLARGPTAAPSAPPPPSVALPAGYEIVSHVLTPTESYLPKRDGMPSGIVLLDVREKAKNQNLCKALLGARTATVKTEAQARRDNPNGDFLVTNWPVTGPVVHEDDCVELLAKYDFDRAARVKGAYALNASRGPFFLALDPTGEIVFLDLKDASAEEVFKATSDWMKLALASPQNRPAAEQRLGLVAGTNRLFARLAGGFGSLVGANPAAPTLIRFNDPVKGTARQFNIYKAGVYLIGATFVL